MMHPYRIPGKVVSLPSEPELQSKWRSTIMERLKRFDLLGLWVFTLTVTYCFPAGILHYILAARYMQAGHWIGAAYIFSGTLSLGSGMLGTYMFIKLIKDGLKK